MDVAPIPALVLFGALGAAAAGWAEDYLTGPPVDAAIVLAVDVSGSMDPEELAIQRAGYLAALRHPDLIRIVAAGRHGRVAFSHFEWAGQVRRITTIPWRIIDRPAAIAAFANGDGSTSPPTRSLRLPDRRATGYGEFQAQAGPDLGTRAHLDKHLKYKYYIRIVNQFLTFAGGSPSVRRALIDMKTPTRGRVGGVGRGGDAGGVSAGAACGEGRRG